MLNNYITALQFNPYASSDREDKYGVFKRVENFNKLDGEPAQLVRHELCVDSDQRCISTRLTGIAINYNALQWFVSDAYLDNSDRLRVYLANTTQYLDIDMGQLRKLQMTPARNLANKVNVCIFMKMPSENTDAYSRNNSEMWFHLIFLSNMFEKILNELSHIPAIKELMLSRIL